VVLAVHVRQCLRLVRAFASAAGAIGALAWVPAAQAASPWSQLPGSFVQTTDTAVGFVRLADGSLELAYRVPAGDPANEALATAVISPTGQVSPGPLIISDWSGLNNPALVLEPGGLRAFWGGIQDPTVDSPVPGLETATAPGPAGPWTHPLGGIDVASCSDTDLICPPGYLAELYTYAATPSALTLADGITLQAWQAGSLGVYAHRGTSPARDTDGGQLDDTGSANPQGPPDASDDLNAGSGQNFQDQPGSISGCCGYDPKLAADGITGQPSIAWFSNATDWTGVYVQEVDTHGNPTGGSPYHAPGSEGNTTSLRGQTPLTTRPGHPGVVTAFTTGSPPDKVLVWTAPYHTSSGALFDTPKPIVVSNGGAEVRNVNITADSSGRLWVVWTRDVGGPVEVFAVRSDSAIGALHFGATVSLTGPSGTDNSFALSASPSGNGLDILGTFGSTVDSTSAVWHARVEPGESVSSNPVTVVSGRKTTVAVHVSDAGHPLAGATVTVVGRASNARSRHHHVISARTNSSGVARLRVGPFAHSTTLKFRVTKPSYTTSTLGVRIRVARAKHHK
jgi:hypothetical protein